MLLTAARLLLAAKSAIGRQNSGEKSGVSATATSARSKMPYKNDPRA
jgi:hypothetical protein